MFKIKLALKVMLGMLFLNMMACNKNTTCVTKITCKDVNGDKIDKAVINLYAIVENENKAKIKADMEAEGTTDRNGEVVFSFKLPAIYDVKVTVGTKTVTGIVKLEEGKTVYKEMRIN